MDIIQTILKRPASTLLIVLAIIVFGVGSLSSMPLEYFPDMEMPMELVMITWPGADADSIERLVTEPVEDECETQSDVDTVASYTFDNYTMVQIQYNYGTDLDEAYSDLKMAMDNLDLPDECEDPIIMELSFDAMPTMMFSVQGTENVDVQSLLNNVVTPDLEAIRDVAQVSVSGASSEYLKIVLDEEKMNQYGLNISSVAASIAAADFDMPIGDVTMGSQDIALSAEGNLDFTSPSFLNIPLQTLSGQMIRLSDVCTFCNLAREDAESISRYNGTENISLQITKAKSAFTVTTCNAVEEVLEQYADAGLEFEIIYSEADQIMETLRSIVQTLATGVVLTMLILLLFFGEIRASLIVACSMPLSILISMILLYFMGFNFDLVTGTSLVIAIGMIVDNSIVVLESCMRAQERGLDFRTAAVQGTKDVMMSVLASTLTTVVVYVPLAMAEGMSGQMARPLSWTISLTMLSSFLCAVTIVPLVFFLVKPVAKEDIPVNRLVRKFHGFYRKMMPSLLRHPIRVMLVAVGILAVSIAMALQLEFKLFPSSYDGSISVTASFRSGTKLEVIDERIQPLEQALLDDENFDRVSVTVSDESASLTAYAADDCKRSSEEAVEEYTRLFSDVVDMDVVISPSGSNSLSSLMGSGNTVDITLEGNDLDTLREGAEMVASAMEQVPGVLRIDNPFNESRSQGKLIIDSQKAAAVGTSQAAVASQIYYLRNGVTACTIDYDDNEYDVVLEFDNDQYEDINNLLAYPIVTNSGQYVTLEDLTTVEYSTTLPSLQRQDGEFVVTVSATVTEASQYDAEDEIEAAVSEMNFPGDVEEGQSAMDKLTEDETSSLTLILATAVFLVFLVMGVQFNSPRLSIMVMVCIPFSLAGSFGLLFLSGKPMSMLGIMGFLMLFGIVVNNGILLVDTTNSLRQEMSLQDALVEAGVIRLRPILMTTLTTILSMVPMLFSSNEGMVMMREMAYIIIGGLTASTALALFMMPPFYLLIRNERVDGSRHGRKKRLPESTDSENSLPEQIADPLNTHST